MMFPHWIRMDMVLILKFPFTWGPHLYWKTRQSRAEQRHAWILTDSSQSFMQHLHWTLQHTHTHTSLTCQFGPKSCARFNLARFPRCFYSAACLFGLWVPLRWVDAWPLVSFTRVTHIHAHDSTSWTVVTPCVCPAQKTSALHWL